MLLKKKPYTNTHLVNDFCHQAIHKENAQSVLLWENIVQRFKYAGCQILARESTLGHKRIHFALHSCLPTKVYNRRVPVTR